MTKSKDDFRSFKETIKSERGLASRYAQDPHLTSWCAEAEQLPEADSDAATRKLQ
jgi:hypothetical protein